MVVVLHLRLGERRAAVDAPVHRLLALVDEPAFDERSERPRDVGLIAKAHRDVGVVPVAEDAQPLELSGHHPYELLGVRAAGAADVGH
jgi:hypothetical protein